MAQMPKAATFWAARQEEIYLGVVAVFLIFQQSVCLLFGVLLISPAVS